MANDENKIILEFPATNVEIEFGETITFDNISGFLNSDRVTYNGESLTEEIAHLEDGIENINNKIAPEYDEEEIYYRGDIVLYNGVLYECDNTDASGEFNPSDWKEITLGEGIEDVRDLLDSDYYTKSQSDYRFLGKTNPTGSGYFGLNRSGSAGANSVSVGWHNVANAQSSFAEGESNTSSGYASHSEGYGNAASGLMAHAEGVTTESSGYGSHSEGVGTIANHIGQHVIGTYNVADPSTAQPTAKGNYIEIVGNGTDDNRRRNARTLDWSGNETLMGDLTYNGNKSLTSEISRLDNRITDLPEPMVFKGTLGVGGTIETLPTASASNEGWMFKCITAGTYAGLTLKVGDTVTCFNPPNTSTYYWDKTGSQDTDTDTWRAIKVNGTEELGSGISSGSVDFVGSENIDVEFDSNGNKVGVKTKNIYTKEQVDDIVYGILPDDTASGSVANFETDLALPIKSLEIDVNAKQDLHGYDYPWVGGAGKNKLQVMPFETKTSNGITFTYNNDGTVTINGTSTGRVYQYLRTYTDGWLKNDNVYAVSMRGLPDTALSTFLNMSYSDNGTTYAGSYGRVTGNSEMTITPNHEYNSVLLDIPEGQTFNNNKIYVQIEEGSVATEWTPYENICPISGWSEISLVHCGKNLFNDTKWFTDNGYTLQPDGSWYKNTTPLNAVLWSNTSGYSGQIYIRFQYKYVSENVGFRIRIVYTDDTVTEIYTSATTTYTVREVVSTSGKTVKEIKTTYGTNIGSYIKDFSINLVDYIYEPYNGNTEVINLNGTYYGGHFTQDKAGHRRFEVTHGYYNLNTLSWTHNVNGFWQANKPDDMARCNASVVPQVIAEKYQMQTGTWVYGHGSTYGYFGMNGGLIYITDENTPSGYIVAPLATPIIIDLPDGEPIITLNGTNNIYADTGDTSVVFKDSVNGYVEKKMASVQALALNT